MSPWVSGAPWLGTRPKDATTALVTATRGDRGRFGNARPGDSGHPGLAAAGPLLERKARVLFEQSLFNAHPRSLDTSRPRLRRSASLATSWPLR